MSDLIVQLKRVDNGLLVIFHHSLIDILESEEVPFDEGLIVTFDDDVLSYSLAAFRRRIMNGLVIYRPDGTAVRGTLVGSMGELPNKPVEHENLANHPFQLSLLFTSEDVTGDFETISFDFGNWRLGSSAVITCHYVDFPKIKHPVLWNERGLYPLFPETDKTTFLGSMSVLAVQSLNSPDIGFSSLGVEPDHLRHELLLPVGTALKLVDWAEGEEPSAHDLLHMSQRRRLEAALTEHAFTSKFARINDGSHLLLPETRRIRWFDRSSLRRGLALEGQDIPVATGFVGLVEIYRPEPKVSVSINHRGWTNLAYHLTFTAREGDRVLTRRAGRELQETWSIELDPLKAMALPEIPPTHKGKLHFLILGLTILAILPAVTWRRGRSLMLLVIVAGLAVSVFLLPRLSPDVSAERLEAQLRYAFISATGTNERRGLELLQAMCTPELAARLYIESRSRLTGPWAVRSGLEIESLVLDEFIPQSSGQARAQWTVRCRVRHWGHGHDRSVRFDALIGFASDGRLATMELLDKQLEEASSAKLSGS